MRTAAMLKKSDIAASLRVGSAHSPTVRPDIGDYRWTNGSKLTRSRPTKASAKMSAKADRSADGSFMQLQRRFIGHFGHSTELDHSGGFQGSTAIRRRESVDWCSGLRAEIQRRSPPLAVNGSSHSPRGPSTHCRRSTAVVYPFIFPWPLKLIASRLRGSAR
jgi:hypothetical protein